MGRTTWAASRGASGELAPDPVRFPAGMAALGTMIRSRGFRFGGIALIGQTPTDDIPPTYRSDHLWLYEAGVRTQWRERTLVADATVYRIDWTDPQLTQLTQTGTLLYIDNVGAARVVGGEVALGWRTPIPGL